MHDPQPLESPRTARREEDMKKLAESLKFLDLKDLKFKAKEQSKKQSITLKDRTNALDSLFGDNKEAP